MSQSFSDHSLLHNNAANNMLLYVTLGQGITWIAYYESFIHTTEILFNIIFKDHRMI